VVDSAMPPYQPLFRTILEDLRASIANGSLRPGEKIPTAKELAEQYNCAIGTARRALEIMLEAGELTARPGIGTFVLEKESKR
jgi:GntR family transcriptional regulator